MSREKEEEFKRGKHVKYFLRCINALPMAYKAMDTSRMTVFFFAISGLDLLDALHEIQTNKSKMVDWIYSLQILPDKNGTGVGKCGFRGSSFLGYQFNEKGSYTASEFYEGSHIAMTYTALLSLIILGDDLSRVNKKAVIEGLRTLQLKNGSQPTKKATGCEIVLLQLLSSRCISQEEQIGLELAFKTKANCYDYGLSQGPQLEAHGGSTFCAIASLVLMDKLNECFSNKEIEKLKSWCLRRQKDGFQGRPNKPVDTCYSFWVGASLKLLQSYDMIDGSLNNEYLLSTQHQLIGGFSKWPDCHSDILHSYFGICGLALLNLYGLQSLSPALNISERAHKHLLKLHQDDSFSES